MEAQIDHLSDAEAVRLLATLTRAQEQDPGTAPPEPTPDVQRSLQEAFGAAPEASGVSEGDLARAALHLYALDPSYRAGLEALLENPPPQRFLVGEVALAAAVLVALQLHVRFERKGDGTWSVLVEKPSAGEEVLKPVVEKLLGFLGASRS